MRFKTKDVARAGVIAAVYAALTLVAIQTLSVFSYGPLQFRVSEAVTVLACLTPAAVPGLWLGAVLANGIMLTQFGALGLFDVVFGSLGTLLGAMWTWRHRKRPLIALLGPVVANALIVPAYLPVLLGVAGLDFYRLSFLGIDASGAWWSMYLFGVVTVGIGEALVVYGLGLPTLLLLKRLGIERTLSGERAE